MLNVKYERGGGGGIKRGDGGGWGGGEVTGKPNHQRSMELKDTKNLYMRKT